MTLLSSAMASVEQRMNGYHSNKIVVKDVKGSVLGKMDRPLNMSHSDFVAAYVKMITDIGDREVKTMSALRTAKRGQNLDDAACTLNIIVN